MSISARKGHENDSLEIAREGSDSGSARHPGRRTLTQTVQRGAAPVGPRPANHGSGKPEALQWKVSAGHHAPAGADIQFGLDRKAADDNGVQDGAEDAVAAAAADRGAPLPRDLQSSLGDSLGADLGGVRVHTGEASQAAASALGARAYTTGQDIHFGAGEYSPGTPSGDHLLAHEVAHTVQQSGAAPAHQPQLKLEVSSPGDAHEVEADRFADAFVAGAGAGAGSPGIAPIGGGAVSRTRIQRDFDPNKKKPPAQDMDDDDKPKWNPEVSVGAPAPATVNLGGTTRVSGNVSNAAQAPAGTTMGWRWSSLAKPGIEQGATPPLGASGSPSVKVTSLEHMAHAPVAGLLYTLPGQGDKVKDAPQPSAFTVAEPQITWTMEHIDGPAEDLEGPPPERTSSKLIGGDTVKLIAKVGNVENAEKIAVPGLWNCGSKGEVKPVWAGNTLTYSFVVQAVKGVEPPPMTVAKAQIKLPAGGAPRFFDHEFQYQIMPPSKTDKKWATDLRAEVEKVQEAAQAATDALNADADVAVPGLKQAQDAYVSFDHAYKEAVDRFTKGVKEAIQKAEELRENVKKVATVAIKAAGGGEIVEVIGKAGEIVEKAAKVAAILDMIDKGSKGIKSDGGGDSGGKLEIKTAANDQTDWKALITSALQTFEKYIKGNQSIATVTRESLSTVKFLNQVIEGKLPKGAQKTPQGIKADKFGDGSDRAVEALGALKATGVSADAVAFGTSAARALSTQSAQKIEQDIAIKWMASLSRKEVDAIDDAEGYLEKLGVMNAKGNRLGLETGLITTEWDTVVLRLRAKIEVEAMGMVGRMTKWYGGKRMGDSIVGGVANPNNSRSWKARGTTKLKPAAGGEVRVTAYSIAPIDASVQSNWEHVNEDRAEAMLRMNVTLSVEPVGETINTEPVPYDY